MNKNEMRHNRMQYESFMEPIRVAMIDGKEVQYDVCTSTRSSIGPEINWHYLGTGYVYSINGIMQGYGPDDVMHFWVHK